MLTPYPLLFALLTTSKLHFCTTGTSYNTVDAPAVGPAVGPAVDGTVDGTGYVSRPWQGYY
jgi:hypothetical protein